MDRATLAAYDAAAAAFADEWHAQPAPNDLHALIRRFLRPGRTADIGCGSGREVAWLAANGYSAVGFDASEALLAQARARYPDLSFRAAALPELAGVGEGGFDNVLCETVIMHLPCEAIAPSVHRLLALLGAGGTLYVSWRVVAADLRDANGRLYTGIDADLVRQALAGTTVLFDESVVSASSGRIVHRMVARRG
jgi:SAM-dependent methyltransferase